MRSGALRELALTIPRARRLKSLYRICFMTVWYFYVLQPIGSNYALT